MEELRELADKLDQVLSAQVQMAALQTHMQSDLAEIKCEVKDVKRMALEHERDLAVLKDWRSAVQPSIAANTSGVVDLKVQAAKMAALGGSFGAVVGVIAAILKVAGVM